MYSYPPVAGRIEEGAATADAAELEEAEEEDKDEWDRWKYQDNKNKTAMRKSPTTVISRRRKGKEDEEDEEGERGVAAGSEQ